MLKFICDNCGKNSSIISVCTAGDDAVYCSKICRNKNYKRHMEICCDITEIFRFCNYCNSRVHPNNLCQEPNCEMSYICPKCLDSGIHKSDCGNVCVTFEAIQELCNTFKSIKISGTDLITTACNIIPMGQPESLVLQLQATHKKIDYTTATLEPSTSRNTKFHKFLIVESIREITHVLKYGIQEIDVWRYPLAIKVVDSSTKQVLFETKRTLL